MKKDLLNSGAKLVAVLFLFFFSFTTSDLSAQTDAFATSSIMHNGTRYDVDGLLDRNTYVDDAVASATFLAEAQNQNSISETTGDDFLQIEANFKSGFYKQLHKSVADGSSVKDALRDVIYHAQSMMNTAYADYPSTVTRPDLLQVVSEAVNLVAL